MFIDRYDGKMAIIKIIKLHLCQKGFDFTKNISGIDITSFRSTLTKYKSVK